MMRKPMRGLIVIFLAVVLSGALWGGPIHAADFTLRAVTAWPKSVYEVQNFMKFLDMVEQNVQEEAPGRLEIKYMGGPETIPNQEQVEACRKGLVDMVFTTVGYYTSIMPVVDGLSTTKLTPWEERAQGVNDFLNTLHQEKVNSYYLGRLGTGIPFMLYLTKPIDKADLKGFKIRVSPTNIGFVKAMGGQPVVIPPPEVYTGLERGVVNGVIWPAGLIRDWGWHEVIEYLVEPGFYSAINVVLVNMDAWGKLPADLKELLIRTEEEAERWAVARGRNHVASEMEKFVGEGIQVIRLPDAETQKMLDAANETLWKDVISKAPESGPKLQELISR